MIVSCPECKKKFKADIARRSAEETITTCSFCSHTFSVVVAEERIRRLEKTGVIFKDATTGTAHVEEISLPATPSGGSMDLERTEVLDDPFQSKTLVEGLDQEILKEIQNALADAEDHPTVDQTSFLTPLEEESTSKLQELPKVKLEEISAVQLKNHHTDENNYFKLKSGKKEVSESDSSLDSADLDDLASLLKGDVSAPSLPPPPPVVKAAKANDSLELESIVPPAALPTVEPKATPSVRSTNSRILSQTIDLGTGEATAAARAIEVGFWAAVVSLSLSCWIMLFPEIGLLRSVKSAILGGVLWDPVQSIESVRAFREKQWVWIEGEFLNRTGEKLLAADIDVELLGQNDHIVDRWTVPVGKGLDPVESIPLPSREELRRRIASVRMTQPVRPLDREGFSIPYYDPDRAILGVRVTQVRLRTGE